MLHSDGQPQPRRTGGRKTGEMDTTGAFNNPARNYSTTDDDLDIDDDDDIVTGNPRSSSSVIRRRTNLAPPSRTTGMQPAPIANRRTQQSPAAKLPQTPQSPQSPQQYRGPSPRRPPLGEGQDHNKWRVHWLLYVGIGMIAMLVVWVLGSSLLAWVSLEYNNVVYGTPRTYQTDAIVGHGGDSIQHPSHFIAINLNRQVIIVEFMAGNPAKSIDYVVPYYILGPGGDLTPVTLSFRDVTGDGRPDMIVDIHLSPQDQTFVFVNDGTKFRAPNANDNIHL